MPDIRNSSIDPSLYGPISQQEEVRVDTGPAPLETGPAPLEASAAAKARAKRFGLSLFWRTFLFLCGLVMISIVAWLQILRWFEAEPRALQTGDQLVSTINLASTALRYADPIQRITLIKAIADQEKLRIVPREPGDQVSPLEPSTANKRIEKQVRSRLANTELAGSVNGQPGLWVGFGIDQSRYWLVADQARFAVQPSAWWAWLGTAAFLALLGAAVGARLINRPLRELSFAASRLREGDFIASRLDESAATREIREVNAGFNRMADQLAKVEQDRAVMLAGISHDLRTPLARLRLETEISVADEEARNHMAADIDQLDAIIDKFLDYARPDAVNLASVNVREVIEACLYSVKDTSQMRIRAAVAHDVFVLADEVELMRVITNLIENARRYGKTVDTGIAQIDISARMNEHWVFIRVRDHGLGVAAEMLPNLIKPFFRGDAARTAATGAGLGLAIVEKTVTRMGGVFALTNATNGGLAAHVQLQRARGLVMPT
jgi:two-component system, OmpR family, osmolarity sensor histidine kinase EnvZ